VSPVILQDFNQGTSFSSLSPQLGQVFFIGDGLTGNGTGSRQSFIAPLGATRLYLGIPDGEFLRGVPGQYQDNGGSFAVSGEVVSPQNSNGGSGATSNSNASVLGNGFIPEVYLRVVQTVGANIRQAETPGNRFFDVPNGSLSNLYNIPAGGVLASFPNGTRALDGNDTVIGSAANDVIYGNQGDDSLRGEAGDDNLLGGRDNDILEGGAGTDYINGNIGNDFVSGGDGNDYVRGGQGNDILLGGEGADILIGDFGTDTLTGGIGPDAFIIRSSVEPNPTRDLADVISDFSSLDDVILITGSFTIRDLAIEASGSDTTIRTLSGNFLARVLNNTPGRVQESLVVIPENSPILTL
jgi:Ca2+-binding RTX toxin-like protein